MSLIMNYPRLARDVHATLKEKGVQTRAELNRLYGTNSDMKKGDALTLVIRSLIVFGHIQRFFDSDSSTVHFWVTGMESPYEPDQGSKAVTADLEDWFTKPILQGVDVPPKNPTPPVQQPYRENPRLVQPRPVAPPPLTAQIDLGVTQDTKDEDDEAVARLEAALDKTTSELPDAVAQKAIELRKLANELTTDQFILELGKVMPAFTEDNIKTFLGHKIKNAVLGMRLKYMCTTGKLNEGIHKLKLTKIYWTPGMPVPEGYHQSVFNAEMKTKLLGIGRKGGRKPKEEVIEDSRVVRDEDDDWPPKRMEVKQVEKEPAQVLSTDDKEGPYFGHSTEDGFYMTREDGTLVVFTPKETKAMLETLQLFRLDVLLKQYQIEG